MKQTKAFSLLELSLVILVIAMLTLSVTQVYRLVEDHRKVNLAVNQILTVYQAGANYEVLPNISTSLIPVFIADGYLSDDFQLSTINPWGGSIDAKANGADLNKLRIEMFKVPWEQCENIRIKFEKNANYFNGGCDENEETKITYLWLELAYNPIVKTQ